VQDSRYQTLVVRFGGGALFETAEAARPIVIDDDGNTWWGRLGARLAQSRVEELRSQREDGTMSVLFLCGTSLALAEVSDCVNVVTGQNLTGAPLLCTPSRTKPGAWFRLEDIIALRDSDAVLRVRLECNKRPLSKSSTAAQNPVSYATVDHESLTAWRAGLC
jgi:hypothetical protein